jgi:DNA ligase (NAD+)
MGGVTVRRISVHNWSNIRNLGISLGAKVLIKRANEVIPQIIKVTGFDPLAASEEIFPPSTCPVCDSAVAVDGEYHVCTNPVCPAVVAGTIRKWIINLEIDNFGEKLIEQLMDAGKLRTIPDLYRLTESDLTALDRVGTRSAQKALQNLHAKKEVPLHLFLGSLNIRGFGKTLAQHLVDAGMDTLASVRALTPAQLAEVPQFGPERSQIICGSLTQLAGVIDDLCQFVTIKNPAPTSGALAGMTICLTGKLSRSKKAWQELIEAAGGKFTNTVSKNLDMLVCADPESGSSKLVKAAKLSVKIIAETDLEGML